MKITYYYIKEYGNIPYVVQGGFGVYTGNRPKKIADAVGGLFLNDVLRHDMSVKAQLASNREATKVIAKEIGEASLTPL